MAGLNDATAFNKVVDIVSQGAPLLATILGSPFAGVAVSLIASAFGIPSPDIHEISNAINRDPEAISKLKALQYNHAETLEKIVAEMYATEVEDRVSARQNSAIFKDFLRHMAYLVTFGFFGTLLLLFLPLPLDANEHDLILVLIGMLASKWQTMIDFFYGSSSQHQNSIGTK